MFFFFDFDDYSISDLIDRMKFIKPIKDIVDETGIGQSTISAWKQRNTFPKVDDFYKICKCLNVSMEYLLTGENKQDDKLPEDEQTLLKHYRNLDPASKHHVDLIVEALDN